MNFVKDLFTLDGRKKSMKKPKEIKPHPKARKITICDCYIHDSELFWNWDVPDNHSMQMQKGWFVPRKVGKK